MNETNSYNQLAPLNSKKFEQFFDNDKHLINEHEFRKTIFKGGIEPDIRPDAWRFLFQYYSYNSDPRERDTRHLEQTIDYGVMKAKWEQIVKLIENQPESSYESIKLPNFPFNLFDLKKIEINQELNSKVNIDSMKIQSFLKISRKTIDIKKLMEDIKLIEKDIPRTGFLIDLDKLKIDNNRVQSLSNKLRDILITFAAFNQGEKEKNQFNLGYTQGMNELASIFLCVFENDETSAFWCFSNFMLLDLYTTSAITLNKSEIEKSDSLKTTVAYYFSGNGIGLKLKQLSHLLKIVDSQLHQRLSELDLEGLFFCHEWLLIYFKRHFKSTDGIYLKCFEKIASHFIELNTASLEKTQIDVGSLYTFDLFISLALLNQMRESLLDRKQCDSFADVYEIRTKYENLFPQNFDKTFFIAENLFKDYCNLHLYSAKNADNSKTKPQNKQNGLYEFIFGKSND